MAERRSSFNPFRIWSSTSTSNRRTSTQASAQPTGKKTSPQSSPAAERSSAGQTTTPQAETRLAGHSNMPLANTNPPRQSSSAPTPTPKTPSTAEIRPAENVNNPTLTNQSPTKTRSAGSANNANNQIKTTPSTTETQSTEQTNTRTSTTNTNAPQSSTTPTPNPTTPSTAETPSSEIANSLTPTNPTPSETQSTAENENNQTPTIPSSFGTQPAGQTNTTNNAPTNPHKDETQPSEKAITPSSSTPLTDEVQTQTSGRSNPMPPSSEAQKANQSTLTSSPTRAIVQSRSSPQPSSPSRAAPPRAPTSSPSRMGSVSQKAASRSPKLTSSPSTKGVKSNINTSTKLRQKSKEISHPLSNSTGEASESSASEQEPLEDQQSKNVKSDSADGEDKPLVTSNMKPEETKEVKEVIQETKSAANNEMNQKGGDFLTAKVDDAKSEEMHKETQGPLGKKETLPTSHFNGKPPRTNSQPGNKSTSDPTNKTSTQSSSEQVPFHKEIRDDISTFVNRMAIGDPKSAPNDRPVSVITLAGENRGASMQLGTDSSKGKGAVPIHRGYKINPDNSPEETTNGDESLKSKNSRDTEGKEDQPTEAYVNNNTQGINNSIVFSSSLTERDPGVHMIVTRASSKEPTKPNDEKGHVEMKKAEVKMTPPEKLTYEPTVRRRCLRGLLLESSDSDSGNPEKPRRHGCRVGCNEKSNAT